MLSNSTALKSSSLSFILPSTIPTVPTNKGYLGICSSCHTRFFGCPGKNSSTLINGIQAEDQSWEPAFSSLLAICSPRPLAYANDAEAHNSKVSIAPWALENYLVHLEKMTSLPIPKGLTPPKNFWKLIGRKPPRDKFVSTLILPSSPIIFASLQPVWQLCHLKAGRDCMLFIVDFPQVTKLGKELP